MGPRPQHAAACACSSRTSAGAARDWYRGTADAVYQNSPTLADCVPEHALILAGDHIYKMDYRAMIAFHGERRPT